MRFKQLRGTREQLSQLLVLGLGLLQDGDVGIGVFPGANTIRDTPMMTSAATPHSSPRAIRLRNACTAISAAWAKLDHAVKAMRLRFDDGSRAASNKKMPSVT